MRRVTIIAAVSGLLGCSTPPGPDLNPPVSDSVTVALPGYTISVEAAPLEARRGDTLTVTVKAKSQNGTPFTVIAYTSCDLFFSIETLAGAALPLGIPCMNSETPVRFAPFEEKIRTYRFLVPQGDTFAPGTYRVVGMFGFGEYAGSRSTPVDLVIRP